MARILIAEDDPSMRQFLALALERAGHSVDVREDGLEALNTLENTLKDGQSYDLLLADIVMPGMDGIELSQRAAKLAPAMKIMFITGFAAVILDQQGQKPDANTEILAKPFHLKDLVDRVEHLLAA
jgi:two-component system cell cycle response regulator CpdR